MSAEEAITTPSKRNTLTITAWGETKTIREWVSDPRCPVDYFVLYSRYFTHKWDAKRAIITQVGK